VAEIAGLISYSFGTEEVDKYTILYKKVIIGLFLPSTGGWGCPFSLHQWVGLSLPSTVGWGHPFPLLVVGDCPFHPCANIHMILVVTSLVKLI